MIQQDEFDLTLGRLVRQVLRQEMQDVLREELRHLTPAPAPAQRNAKFLTEKEVAERLNIAVATLRRWRNDPQHPLRWSKVSGQVGRTGGRVRYPTESVEAFEEYCRT